MVGDFVNLSIRNRAGWEELDSFSETGNFIGKHPVLKSVNKYRSLRELWQTDRIQFMEDYGKCRHTLAKYRGILKKAETEADKAHTQARIEELEIKYQNMQRIAENG